MNRDLLVTGISSILLFAAIIFWQELFIFQKTTTGYPAWAKSLSYPMMGAHVIVILTLVPLAVTGKANLSFIKSISMSSIISPLLAISTLTIVNNTAFSFNGFTNDIMWVIGVNCIPPALLVIMCRVIYDLLTNERANKAIKSDAKKRRALS